MSNPVSVFVGTYVGGGGTSGSTFVTFSFQCTHAFETWVPIIITSPGTTSISAGAEATVYRSTDGGTTWETVGTIGAAFPKPTIASQVQRQDVVLPPGQFLISVMVGGGTSSTWTAQLGTAWQITAYA